MTLAEVLSNPTTSIPVAGKVFYDLGRSGSYEAARRGEIPTIRIGGKLRVPVAPIAAKLGLKTTFGEAA